MKSSQPKPEIDWVQYRLNRLDSLGDRLNLLIVLVAPAEMLIEKAALLDLTTVDMSRRFLKKSFVSAPGRSVNTPYSLDVPLKPGEVSRA